MKNRAAAIRHVIPCRDPHRKVARRLTAPCILAGALLPGCNSAPPAVEPVDIDARVAGLQAIETYDRDGDGQLGDDELAAVPGIAKHKDLYDGDNDGLISEDEIAQRIRSWEDGGLGIRRVMVHVTLAGQPLPGATVRLVPEAYLGDGPKPAEGKTDPSGSTAVSVGSHDLPEEIRAARMRGVYGGTYKIEVTHPQMAIPPRYNVETTLGTEVARETLGHRLELVLEKN